jgi:hypothetical protein
VLALLLEEQGERVERQIAATNEPLVVLFDDQAGREPDQ